MLAAWSYCPARSSSNPWPIACAGSDRAAKSRSPRTQLRPRGIEPAEVFEDQAPLLGGQALQLFPRRVAEPRPRPRRAGLQHLGDVDAVARGGATDPLLILVGLVVRQGTTGVEQPVVQPLLPLDGLLIAAPSVELTRELLRLLRERAGGGARPAGLE